RIQERGPPPRRTKIGLKALLVVSEVAAHRVGKSHLRRAYDCKARSGEGFHQAGCPFDSDLEWLVPLYRRPMKQANVVHRITTAGLMIDATIVPHHEIAQGPFMTIHVPWRRLVSK